MSTTQHEGLEGPLTALPVQIVELPSGVLLRRGATEVQFEGDGAKEIIELIVKRASAGPVTVAELLNVVPEGVRDATVAAVDALVTRGLLVRGAAEANGDGGGERPTDVLYWHFGSSAAEVGERLARVRFAIVGVNDVSRSLIDALTAEGDRWSITMIDHPLLRNPRYFDQDGRLRDQRWPTEAAPVPVAGAGDLASARGELDCVVACSDFGGMHLLREWNEFCVRNGLAFLPVLLHNFVGLIGPLVIPGETPCLECVRARENANLDDPEVRRAVDVAALDGQHVTASLPAMSVITGATAAIELVKFYGGIVPTRQVGTLLELNMLGPVLTPRRVLRLPRCKICSAGARQSAASPLVQPFQPRAR